MFIITGYVYEKFWFRKPAFVINKTTKVENIIGPTWSLWYTKDTFILVEEK